MNDKYFRRLQRAKELEISEEFVQPNIILGSTLDDYYEDTLNQGLVGPSSLFGSILIDADTLSYGLITRNIEFPFISDTDILNHGLITLDIKDDIVVSLLESASTFFNSKLGQPMLGSNLEYTNILHSGILFMDEAISYEQLQDKKYIPIVFQFLPFITGSLLKDIDIINRGDVYSAEIHGSLLQSLDNIFSGDIANIVIPVYKILISNEIVGGNTVNLVKKVVLVSPRKAPVDKHVIKTKTSNV